MEKLMLNRKKTRSRACGLTTKLAPIVGIALLAGSNPALTAAADGSEANPVSPVRKIQHDSNRGARDHTTPEGAAESDYRTIDGSGNNPNDPNMGAADTRHA